MNANRAELLLSPGTALSYSAGNSNLDPWAFRIVGTGGDRLGRAVEMFPELGLALAEAPPVVVNCYPATLGSFPQAIFVDTYLRQANVSRALLLAYVSKRTVILLGQPLPVFEFLLAHERSANPLPGNVILALGGYVCPQSLEEAFRELISSMGARAVILFAYGVGELQYGCLLGMNRSPAGDVIYRQATDDVSVSVDSGLLVLRKTVENGEVIECRPGDFAEVHLNGFVIGNPLERLDTDILANLESWSGVHWERRTGYVGRTRGSYCYQLREGTGDPAGDERLFFDFAREYPFSWLDKPAWGRRNGLPEVSA